jgi:uncharacterized protein (DUF1015 family)
VSRSEAAALAAGEPMSFLHVVRSDIDLPDDRRPSRPAGVRAGERNLDGLVADRVLVRDTIRRSSCIARVMGARAQTGVVGCVSVATTSAT